MGVREGAEVGIFGAMKFFVFLSALVVTLVLAPLEGRAAHPDSALGFLNDLPETFQKGVVYVSADNADPHPDTWYVTARNHTGLLMNLTIEGGRIVSQRPTISPRALLGRLAPMNISSIRVNSTDLWRKATEIANERGRRMGSMSLVLQQNGRNADPVWEVWCYDTRGSYFAYFSALATTGRVISRR